MEEEDGGILIFNCVSCNFAKLNKENYESYLKITSQHSDINESESKMKALIKELSAGFFIVDDRVDEMNCVKLRHDMVRFSKDQMTVTILPTTACNFNCIYCFEGFKKSYFLNSELEDCIVRHIDSSLKKGGNLRVTWFGGEPGLAIDSVYSLSHKILEVVNKKKLTYTMLFVTNGYLLNRDMIANLIRYGLDEVQVTIDGPREVHDKRRYLKNGGGTYDVIMNNLKNIADMISIFLRINIVKHNISSFPILLDELEKNGLREKVFIYLNKTTADTDSCYGYKDNVFNVLDYSEVLIEAYELLLKSKFKFKMIPKANAVNCASIGYKSLYINANGDMYRCMSQFDDESQCIGNIRNPEQLNHRLFKWLAWDPFSNEYCIDCNIFPICQGGCPSNWINSSSFVEMKERCSHWKYTLQRLLRMQYEGMKQGIITKEGSNPYGRLQSSNTMIQEEDKNEIIKV